MCIIFCRRGSGAVHYTVAVTSIAAEIAPEDARAAVADAITEFVVENDDSVLEVEENVFDGKTSLFGPLNSNFSYQFLTSYIFFLLALKFLSGMKLLFVFVLIPLERNLHFKCPEKLLGILGNILIPHNNPWE